FLTGEKNFWELIGDGKTADWHFRTNPSGIASDIARVNMSLHPSISKESPLFGTISRCSGCHTNGNLVMKELAPPHNDWFIPSQGEALQGIIGRFKLKHGTDLSDPGTAATVMFHRASEPEHLARCVRESLVEGVKLAVQP